MNPSAWTVAVADADHITHPTIAYVITAAGRAEAIASVTAQHTAITSIPADRVLIVEASPGTPPADAWYGWSDLRGIKALRIVAEPQSVRRIARLRLRLRRWQTGMQAHFDRQARDDCYEIPPQAWNEHLDEATGIAESLTGLLIHDPAAGAEAHAGAGAQQHEPWPRTARQTDRAYEQYVACFPDATQALLYLSRAAGIAVAYLDRGYIEADRGGPLTDDQRQEIRFRPDTYDDLSYTDSHSLYLDQVFARAGVPRWPDDPDSGRDTVEP